MLRRLAHLALSLTLLTAATAPVLANGFAAPPPGAPISATHIEVPASDLPAIRPSPLPAAARARLRATLAKRRDRNLRAFSSYARRGVFPHNYDSDGSLNVWRDRDGHLCAAATMINRSGAHGLVAQTARDNNFIRLADVTEGPLLDWILTSGLTHDEVVAIQEPFMGRAEPEQPTRDWKTVEDARLRARYAVVRRQLATDRDASLDAAVDALAGRPELVAQLL